LLLHTYASPVPRAANFAAVSPSRALAKVEAQKISDRTRAGMARAKAKGVKVGRPRLTIELRQQIAQRAAKGETTYAIARALRIDRHTAAKYAGRD